MTEQPLRGIRVVTIALNVPGPVAAARLHMLGAGVTKVEPPGGDPLSCLCPGWYRVLCAGQETLRLDLKDKASRARLLELLVDADLLLTAQRQASLVRLGLDWHELHPRFPRLAQVAIVGYPEQEADRPGHDLTYLAPFGLVEPPSLPRTLVADLAGAERAVAAALTLLYVRERGEAAGYARIPLAELAESFAAPFRHELTGPDAPLGGGLAAYGLYRARVGWVALAALERRFREQLCRELQLQELTKDALAQAFSARTAVEWEVWARARDLPLSAVRPFGA